MKTSSVGINLIKSFEGCRLTSYRDAAGVLTIGYGHTSGVKENQTITQKEADDLLASDLTGFESKVSKYDGSYHWTQNEFDALVSFCYNIGNIQCLIGSGRTKYQIAQQMLGYVYAGGRKLSGLERRRKAEFELFMKLGEAAEVKNENKSYSYEVGKLYTICVDGLIVRKAPSDTAEKVGYKGLSANAKKHDRDKNGSLDKNTKVTCKEVCQDTSGNTWLKIPSGYIAAIYKGEVFVK